MDYKKIISDCEALREFDQVGADIKCAYCYFRMGNDTRALELIEGILDVEPDHVDALYLKGAMHMMHGDFTKGLPLLELRDKRSYSEDYGLREHTTPKWDGKATDKRVLL